MYLKSIEIHGFKSFANKIVLDFHKGITAIVGPNGSGKSNVSDAVRWVLGEQSARQLRGASMQDVIFAGTQNRKALGYAYVAITLDNSDQALPVDYKELTVARRVYRSGESEYLLNGTPCRLRDVNELFFDTGIGKEGYSIIGQGQIEKILSGKPEERRELFDEAVGIVKYKQRKKVTLKKLEDERENLVRVTDILSELERQVGPLQKQSQTARRYLAAKEELKHLDVNMFLMEAQRLKGQLQDISDKYRIAEDQMDEQKKSLADLKLTYSKMEEDLNQRDLQMEELRKRQKENELTKSRLENQITLLEEQIRSAENADASILNQIQTARSDRKDRAEELSRHERAREELNASLLAAREKLAAARSEYQDLQDRCNAVSAEAEEGQRKLLQLVAERADLKSEEQKYKTTLEQINIRKSRLTQRMLERRTEEGDIGAKADQAQKAYEKSRAKRDAIQEKKETLDADQLNWKNKRRDLRQDIDQKTVAYHRSNSRLESLRNIAERYDGYGNAIKKVMEQKREYPGIEGLVSELIHVPKDYETAIETALGGNIQNIVTDTETTAKRMVTFLKENRAGRATFLPLTSVKGRSQSQTETLLNEPGVIGVASQLVQTDSRYRGIVSYLLGRILLVDQIDHAIALARANHYSLHIVTLDGDYLRPGGSISGGRFKHSGNLLARNREVKQLEEEVAGLKEALSQARMHLEEIDTALALLSDDRAEVQAELEAANLEVNTAKLQWEQAKEISRNSEQAFASLQKEKASLDEQIKEIKEGQKELDQRRQSSGQREVRLKERISVLGTDLEKLNLSAASAFEQLSAIQMAEAAARQKVDFEEENIIRLRAEVDRADQTIEELTRQKKTSGEEAQGKKKQIEEIKMTILAAEDRQEEIETSLKEKQEAYVSLNEAYKSGFEEREKLSDVINSLDKELYRLEAQRQKAQEALESQNNYMWQEYELTLHAAMELMDENLKDRSQMQQRIRSIRDDIRSMGNVNVNAIEQYRELAERYEFLKTQHDDLVRAEDQLVQIIEDLDQGMRRQFSEGFRRIQDQFDATFRELFGGGKGSLELTEGEDVLETGIRIIAQPPGKKLQNMMQMSGGEKSLTAIALLFAIQSLKPSPFCLLDEIEAALDDANVDRFARYLHKLTRNTQFIVITHRRGTMNAADRLYGITMQEKGVSTLVSVNLIESKLDD